MALTPTTIDALDALITEVIRTTTPRITYQGGTAWTPYAAEAGSASKSRRFRLVWEEGDFVKGGIFSNASMEVTATLRVRTDYAGEHELLQRVRQNDLHQLRDRIHTLAATSTNGLILALVKPPGVVRPPNWDKADVAQWDLVYQIRYLLARG